MQREERIAEIAQLARVAVGRQHDRLGPHLAQRRGEGQRVALSHPQDRGLLVDGDPLLLQHRPQAAHQLCAVDLPGAGSSTAPIPGEVQVRLQLGRSQECVGMPRRFRRSTSAWAASARAGSV